MMKLSAIVVDDEEYSRKSLYYLIDANCPNVEIKSIAGSVAEARKLLKTYVIDVVFLDIAMPVENGFELLPDLEANETSVIFTTAFDQYALKAIKASAIDYLLKPVNIEELQISIQKVIEWKTLKTNQKIGNKTYTESLNSLVENINNGSDIQTISLPYSQGFKIKNIKDIVYLEAHNNYTCFHFENEETMMVSKSLKDFEEILPTSHFIRIHKSSIINLQYLKNYSTKTGFVATLNNGTELSVSRRRSPDFLEKVKIYLDK